MSNDYELINAKGSQINFIDQDIWKKNNDFSNLEGN
jgi:hypothetical protein